MQEFIEGIAPDKALLGIDWGAKKIGISVSDISRSFVFPVGVIKNEDPIVARQKILEIIRKKNVCGIIIGNPLKLDGTDGDNAEIVQKFAEQLLRASSLPVLFQDERFTTKLAQRTANKSSCKVLSEDDSNAACHILRTTIMIIQNYWK